MGRKKKAIVEYFPHFVNHKKTMFILESKHKNNGYSFWFKLLELLGNTEHHFLDCNKADQWLFLSAKTFLSEEKITEIIETLVELEAIDLDLWKMKIIRSQNFIDNLFTVYKRRDIDVLEKEDVIDLCIHKYPLYGKNVNIGAQRKGKESIVEETKVNKAFLFNVIVSLFSIKLGLILKDVNKKVLKSLINDHGEDKVFELINRCEIYYSNMKGRSFTYGQSFNKIMNNSSVFLSCDKLNNKMTREHPGKPNNLYKGAVTERDKYIKNQGPEEWEKYLASGKDPNFKTSYELETEEYENNLKVVEG